MFFNRKSKEKIKKMDILITSIVLSTIIAWAFWLKSKKDDQTKEPFWKKIVKIFLWK